MVISCVLRPKGKVLTPWQSSPEAVTYLCDFLSSNGLSTDVTQIDAGELRTFILYLQQKRCFSNHLYSKAQQRGLSGHTVNTYMRSIRAFWSWLVEEEIIQSNPFSRLKIPKPPKKIITTFSPHQIELLLGVMGSSAEGYRGVVMVLTLLDTGLRVNELINLKMENVWLEEGLIKVLGKGNKERRLPIGKRLLAFLWSQKIPPSGREGGEDAIASSNITL